MRTCLIAAGAALIFAGAPALAQVNTGDRNNTPLKANVKPSGKGVKVRAVVLKSKSNGTRSAVVGTRTGASVLGGRNANQSNAAAAGTRTSVLKTRNSHSNSSLANPKPGARVLPAKNGPVRVTGAGKPMAATALTPPKVGGKH